MQKLRRFQPGPHDVLILPCKQGRSNRHGFCLSRFMPKSHKELVCWQLADQLRQLIITHTDEGTPAAKDFRFTSNLRDAISACRNQSEGFYKYKHKPQRPYFVTARASLGEVQDGIEDGRQRKHFSAELAKELDALCGRAMIANLRWLKSLDRPDPGD